MHNRPISITASLLLAASLVSCGDKVSVVQDTSEIMTAPVVTSAEVTEVSEATTEPTEPPTEPFSVDLGAAGGEETPSAFTIEGFETVLQEPELPTGCEVVALNQTLRFLGFDIEKTTLADDFMPIDYNGSVTMNQAYIGDPKARNGFGCLAPVIVQTADKYFASIDSPCYAANISGSETDEIYRQVSCGRPVIVWITMNLAESRPRFRWTAQNGEEMWFADYQHCATIYGYDKEQNIVYIADPLKGNTTYSMERFEYIYGIMGSNAVVICGDASVEGHHVTTEAEKNVVMTSATEKKLLEEDPEVNE